MIKIAICDDEIEITSEIETILNDFRSFNDFESDVYFSGEELYKAIKKGIKYDLIFLDIEMIGIDGLDTARKIRTIDKNVAIVYITSHLENAIDGYDVNALGFMPKPINKEKFKDTYLRILEKISKVDYFFRYTFKRENFNILIDDIIYFESVKRVVFIKTTGDEKKCYIKIDDLESKLIKDGFPFYRINQSLLINPKYVYSQKSNEMTLKNGEEFGIAIGRRKEVGLLFCKLKCGEIID